MSLEQRIKDFVTAVATDIKSINTRISGASGGSVDGLQTTSKNLVGAINELKGQSGSPADASTTVKGIVRLATNTESTTGTSTTLAVTPAGVAAVRASLKSELLGGADAAFDTLKELQDAVAAAEESDVISALTTVVGQKANSADVYTKTAIGDPEADLVSTYNTAKA